MFSDAAIEFLSDYARGAREQPFFLNLCYVAPHDPRQSPEEFEAKYDPSDLPLPDNYRERHPFDNGELHVRDEMLEAWPRRPHSIRRHLSDYYACIEHLDSEIGRVLHFLEEHGLEDTLIVFTSDNGLGVGSHGLMGKQNLYEHSIRVPLIVTGPGVARHWVCDAPCYLHDLFHLFGEWLDVSVPASVEARISLAPALAGEEVQGRESRYFAYRDVQEAVRQGPWKMIAYHTPNGNETQVFDLRSDPHEMNDLSASQDPAVPISALAETLAAKRDEYRIPRNGSPGEAAGSFSP
jgi:arylsulfatase A-like enzyme